MQRLIEPELNALMLSGVGLSIVVDDEAHPPALRLNEPAGEQGRARLHPANAGGYLGVE